MREKNCEPAVLWQQYENEKPFHIDDLPDEIRKKGEKLEYSPGSLIISKGEFTQYIYFINTDKR